MCILEVSEGVLGLERVNGVRETSEKREYCTSARVMWERRSLPWRGQIPETFWKQR